MAKTENLTVRVDPGLRAAADKAAQVVGRTLSEVVRRALRAVIAEAAQERVRARHEAVQEGMRVGLEEGFLAEGLGVRAARRRVVAAQVADAQAAVQGPRKVSRAKRKAARNARQG